MLLAMAAANLQRHASARDENAQALPVGHLVTTRSTRIIAADLGAATLLGRDLRQLEQKPLAALVDIADRRDFRSRVMELPIGERIVDWHLRIVGPLGSSIAVIAELEAAREDERSTPDDLRWTLVYDASRAPDVEADDGPRSEMAHELRQLAHELNQPLAAIVTYVRGMQLRLTNGALTEADLRAALDIVVQEAMRASQIVRDLDRKWGTNT